MASENVDNPPDVGEEDRSSLNDHDDDDNVSTVSSQILGESGLIKPGKYDEILALDEDWSKENDDRLRKIMKMTLKNNHIQEEERQLKEKLKVVILSGKIKAGDKKLRGVRRQLDEALQLIEEERKMKKKHDDELRKKHDDKIRSLDESVTAKMRELEESLTMGKALAHSTPHDKTAVNKAILNEVQSATAKAMDTFIKEQQNNSSAQVQAVMQNLHSLNTDDPTFTPYPWKGKDESDLNSKISITAEKRMKDTVHGRQVSGKEEEPSITIKELTKLVSEIVKEERLNGRCAIRMLNRGLLGELKETVTSYEAENESPETIWYLVQTDGKDRVNKQQAEDQLQELVRKPDNHILRHFATKIWNKAYASTIDIPQEERFQNANAKGITALKRALSDCIPKLVLRQIEVDEKIFAQSIHPRRMKYLEYVNIVKVHVPDSEVLVSTKKPADMGHVRRIKEDRVSALEALAEMSLEELHSLQQKKKNKQNQGGKVSTVQVEGRPSLDKPQPVQTPLGTQTQRNWGQNRQQPQPQPNQQRQGGWIGNRQQQQTPRPYGPNYQATNQTAGWQRRADNRGVGYATQPRFGQTNQYRPFRQGMNQYQNQQGMFKPPGFTPRYQQNQQGFSYRYNGNQQTGGRFTQGYQNRNSGQTRLNPPADIVGKCYVCSGQDHIAPRCQAFGEERRFDFSKERCTNQKCAGYLGYHIIACREQQ